MSKLSASALACFLESPKRYYWQYIKRLEPMMPSMSTFDHDKLCGILWAEFVDRFYKGVEDKPNTEAMLSDWAEQTHGWVSDNTSSKLVSAMTAWAGLYYQLFNPADGVRVESEKLVENERFIGYLDGFNADGIVHEVKSTSRSKQLAEQLWKVQDSIQVKLYCVLTEAQGIRIEFAWKDPPHGIWRSDVKEVSAEKRRQWEQELNALADLIYGLGDDPNNYPCHTDGCCITGKNFVSICPFQILCTDGLSEITGIGFKDRVRRS